MRWIVEPLARAAAGRPWLVILVLAVVTGVLGALASQQQTATDITEFSADTELARGFERIDEQFGAQGGAVQVVVDDGAGGDVLDRDGLVAASRIQQLIRDTPDVADRLAQSSPTNPAVTTWADPVLARAQTLGLQASELTDVFANGLVAGATAGDGAERLSGLVSDDFTAASGDARAGLVIVELASGLTFDQRLQAATALDEALTEADLGFLSAQAFSFELLNDDIQAGFQVELPQLLAISFVLMLIILVALYRRASDVIIGLVGLMATIVWMTGLSVLLGPDYLGITGQFNQLAIAVPVLLVGLGIDYSVHLTTRYREARLAGDPPAHSAGTAVRTVGVALTLATLTTVFGFLSNLVAPLPPIQDFGLFAAVGVASAFVVLGGLVPAARTLLDRRKPGKVAPPVAEGTGTEPATRAIAGLALRAPGVVVAVAALLGLAGAAASTDLSTQFSQEEFIPADSDTARIMTQLDERFGGDVNEETFLLIDGDFTQVRTWNALAAVEGELAEIDGVATTDGRAQTTSPTGLLAQRTRAATAAVARLQQQLAAAVGEGGAEQPPLVVLPDQLAPGDIPEPLRQQLGGLDLDQALAQATGEPEGAEPLDFDELAPLLPADTQARDALAQRLLARQLADRVQTALSGAGQAGFAGLDAAQARQLIQADPATVSLDDLRDAGYPMDQLDAGTRRLLADAQALRAAGWTGTRLADDADIARIREILASGSGEALSGVLTADARSGLSRVSTRVGQEGAARLAEDLRARLGPLREVGADVLVASQPLVIEETLEALSDAQTQAIIVSLAAALILLVAYYGISRRRPMLGLITMLPALLAVPLVLGSMWLLGLAFNALTATIASIAIGIGVPYGIHITNRFVEEIGGGDVDAAIRTTLGNTGAALVGSALTTGAAFAVLMLSSFPPIGQFGGITALTIAYALLASAIVETAALVWWGRREVRRRPRRRRDEPATEELRVGAP